ncbi:MAG: methionyl-tRNA formyltransferase [Mariniblastus sp.]
MRLIMFGTGPFAVPTFEALLKSEHEILALVTRPIADSGKRRKTSENPTRDVGEANGLTILDPQNVNEEDSVQRLIELQADLFVVCDYGQILSRDCLAASRLGGINLHGSLLPKYRGAAPINWCIFNGDPVTGITIIHMTAKLDGGPCLVKSELEIGTTETAEDIEPRLAQLGVEPVIDAIEMLEKWDGQSTIGDVQDKALATKAPRLKKADGLIDWSRSALQIVNQIRAFQPWPGTFCNWESDSLKQPMRLIVHRASAFDLASLATEENPEPSLDLETLEAGQVVHVSKQHLIVLTGEGLLSIEQVQPAGKKSMPVQDFLRGKPPAVGDWLK